MDARCSNAVERLQKSEREVKKLSSELSESMEECKRLRAQAAGLSENLAQGSTSHKTSPTPKAPLQVISDLINAVQSDVEEMSTLI